MVGVKIVVLGFEEVLVGLLVIVVCFEEEIEKVK